MGEWHIIKTFVNSTYHHQSARSLTKYALIKVSHLPVHFFFGYTLTSTLKANVLIQIIVILSAY